MSTKLADLPQLSPPGAGLPKPELFIARLIFKFSRWRSDRAKATAAISALQDKILLLATQCDEATASQQILISRLPGLEDSSRYWSVYMTVEHLRIVNTFIAETIASLLAGKIPTRASDTAAVKPSTAVDARVLAQFEESCRHLATMTEAAPDLTTELRHSHPWFGSLDAAGWHFMAGFHMKLHLKQIQNILAALPGTQSSRS